MAVRMAVASAMKPKISGEAKMPTAQYSPTTESAIARWFGALFSAASVG